MQRGAGPLSWATAVKFLMARKFDVGRGLMLYEQHEATRIREGLVKFEPTADPLRTELETGKFTVLVSRSVAVRVDLSVAFVTAAWSLS